MQCDQFRRVEFSTRSFETAGPDGKRAREGDRGAMATVHFAAMTGALRASWMAVRAKGALSRVTAMPVGDSEVQRFEPFDLAQDRLRAAVERLERLEQMF
jgi:hypothetical protein